MFNSDNLHIQVFLVTGGIYASTELYNPNVGSWTKAGAWLPRAFRGLKATYIADRVLLMGKTLFQLQR